MYVQNIVDMSLQKVGLEICYVMFMKYMEWLNVKYKNLWEKNSNLWIYNSSICKCLFVQFPSESQFKILTNKFEVFCETFHIIGKIDGSHISILAPIIGGEDYYYF
jgi:hypothetical protein